MPFGHILSSCPVSWSVYCVASHWEDAIAMEFSCPKLSSPFSPSPSPSPGLRRPVPPDNDLPLIPPSLLPCHLLRFRHPLNPPLRPPLFPSLSHLPTYLRPRAYILHISNLFLHCLQNFYCRSRERRKRGLEVIRCVSRFKDGWVGEVMEWSQDRLE